MDYFIIEKCLLGLWASLLPFQAPNSPKWAIRNIGLNSKETAKSRHNGGGGGGEGEIRNIEIAIRNIGLNSKETAKSRHNGGGG